MSETANGHIPDSPQVPDQVIAARAVSMLARSISTDGAAAQIVFGLAGMPDKLVLEFPVIALASMQSLIGAMKREAERRNLKTGMVFRNEPKSYSVGHSDEQRGFTALMFNEKTVEEQIFMLRDEDAVKLAEALLKDVRSRGGPRAHGLILPNGKVIGSR